MILFCRCIVIVFLFFSGALRAQQGANYDEAKAGNYPLPPLLKTTGGKNILSENDWETVQRPWILKQFTEQVYGRIPGEPPNMRFRTTALHPGALQGKATRKEVTLFFTNDPAGPALHLLLYLPNNVKGKVPVFMGLNFQGNHSVHADPAIRITDHWKKLHPSDTAPQRGAQAGRWPVELLIDNGYAMATAWYQDLEPDHKDGWKTAIRSTLAAELKIKPEDWSAIAAWAWGMSRIMDFLQLEDRVDAKKVVLTGHSRIGKAALWAAANDKRFAVVISNNSGEGGAALARRNYGETVERINTAFPHWFVAPYKQYNNAIDQLPVDQHMLLALVAPRPLYVASAVEDQWADPKGELLSAVAASEVYRLYGKAGVSASELPALNTPIGDQVRYHIRTGKHDITEYDWREYILFANKVLR